MRFGMQGFSVMLVGIVAASNAFALEASALKKPCDKAANSIIEQFDVKTSLYKGVQADDVVTQAMIVTALGEHLRKYREGHGPWMSEPAKAVVAARDVDAAQGRWRWVALKATHNDKYKSQLESGAKMVLPTATMSKVNLAPTALSKEWLTETFWITRSFCEDKTKEVEINGTKVKWAEVLGENLLKLQKPDGSFSGDLQTNALASLLLTHCYRTLKE